MTAEGSARGKPLAAEHEIKSRSPIYYAAAAGDILGTYRQWRKGVQDPAQISVTYSGLFYDLCAALGRPGVASFPATAPEEVVEPDMAIHSRAPSLQMAGWRYHLAQLGMGRWLLKDIERSGATDVIVMDGVTYWFLLAPAARRGVRIWVSVHTVLQSPFRQPKLLRKLILKLEGRFLRRYCAGALVVSPRIGQQLADLAGPGAPEPQVFLPLYVAADFESFRAPVIADGPFRVFFSGRVEADKGVFDLLAMARELRRTHGEAIVFEVLGEGSALAELRAAVAAEGLGGTFFLPGHCERPELLARLNEAHVVIAPTRSSFPEGLNKAIIEAVLARRPVISSAVCPACDLVAPAVVEVPPDDVDAYRAAILKLYENKRFYEAKVEATAILREAFFDRSRSWFALARAMLEKEG